MYIEVSAALVRARSERTGQSFESAVSEMAKEQVAQVSPSVWHVHDQRARGDISVIVTLFHYPKPGSRAAEAKKIETNGNLAALADWERKCFITVIGVMDVARFRKDFPQYKIEADAVDAMVGMVASVPIAIIKREYHDEIWTVSWLPDSPRSRKMLEVKTPEQRELRPETF
jgi:hypothetical protein